MSYRLETPLIELISHSKEQNTYLRDGNTDPGAWPTGFVYKYLISVSESMKKYPVGSTQTAWASPIRLLPEPAKFATDPNFSLKLWRSYFGILGSQGFLSPQPGRP